MAEHSTQPNWRPPAAENTPTPASPLDPRLERCEALLSDIRDGIDRTTRQEQFHELSLGRLCGGLAQIVAIGLAALALVEWVLTGANETMYARLAFATFAQLVALTGFTAAKRGRSD